ncbi:FHIPEP family type III secretion protein [bacterium]|nr:FHIPEP family type III secretion protein [bacterium]
MLSLCLLPNSMRLLQPANVKQLEEPTSHFLQQIGLRARVDVLQLSPLHLLVTTNCNPSSQEALTRQLHFLYNIDESRGDQLLVIHGRVPFSFRDQPWVLALLSAGCLLVGLSGCLALLRWGARPPQVQRRNPWPARFLKLSPLITLWAVVTASVSPLCLPLNLLVLLLWKVRQRAARQRPILNAPQEAAILLMSFPPEFAAQVFKEMGPEAVHRITLEISKLPPISWGMREAVMATFEGLMASAWPKANRDQCTPSMVFSTLQRFYFQSGVQGQLTETSSLFSRINLRPHVSVLGSLLLSLISLAPGLLMLAWSHQSSPRLESDLRQFVRLNPLAVVQLERDGQTRYLVGLGTQDLNSVRLLVDERARTLGVSTDAIACLGVNRTWRLPPRITAALLLGGGLLLLALRMVQRRRAIPIRSSAPTTSWEPCPVVAPATVPAPAPAPQSPFQPEPKADETKKTISNSVLPLLQVDEVSFEVGRGLLSLVDPGQGARLLERVTSIRRHIAQQCGLVLPGVRFRDNLALANDTYVIRIRGVEVARGTVSVNRLLALGPEEKLAELKGTPALDPTFGQPGLWIDPASQGQATALGLTLLDPVSVVGTQLTTVLRENLAEIFTYTACAELLRQPALSLLLSELETREVGMVKLWKVLREMLRQQVSIRDLSRILEGLLLDGFPGATDEELVELARMAARDSIARELCETEIGKPPVPLVVWRVSEELLDMLEEGPERRSELLEKFQLLSQRMQNAGHQPAVLVDPAYRPGLQKLLMPFKFLRVLSSAELPEWIQLSFFRGEGKL